MRPTRTEAIRQFLIAGTHADLSSLYSHDMEVQVNVAKDNGERVDGDFKGRQWHGYTDGAQTWKSFRIPYKANSEPEYEDTDMSFDLAAHAEGVGMTGWDWKRKLSLWVAYDFDAISGHSLKHAKKMTHEELEDLKKKVSDIEWVTLRKSTSGKGLHLYVFLNPVSTENHSEHAALARAILAKLSHITNYSFESKVDICGGNMWVWHRKMLGTDGLTLIKKGIPLDSPPSNWKDHIKVVRNKRTRSLPKFIEDQKPEVGDQFEEICGQRVRVPLDQDHKRLTDWLEVRYPNCTWWDQDNWCLVTHTSVLLEAHEELQMKGVFRTLATGREKGIDHNCFMYPMRGGVWSVRRFSPGCAEHAAWQQDGVGWTRCYFNRIPDFVTACRIYNGNEDPQGGWYVFDSVEIAVKVAEMLKAELKFPDGFPKSRKCKLKIHKSGRLLFEIPKEESDPTLEGWCGERKKWSKLFNMDSGESEEPEVYTFDDEVRHLSTETGEDYGWVINSDGNWHNEPLEHVKKYLCARGHNKPEIDMILGASVSRYWTLVNMPFKEEYPADRRWNRKAAKLSILPSENRDNLKYDHWTKILKHCGEGLNDSVKLNEWCVANGIQDGGDYLKCWVASLFKHPTAPLPYLFFYGPQNSGKSIFHEALDLLITNGVVRADTALTSHSNFNGELENSVLCIVEETDLRKNITAYNRIKDWVTARQLPIHKKQKQPYRILNTTHWVQMANSHLFCPVFIGDTRITMISVPELTEIIPKDLLLDSLKKEAPDFLSEILNLELPKSSDGRLNIPVIGTEDKSAAERANQTFLEMFLEEKCHYVEGSIIKFSDFYDRFIEWIDPNYVKEWSKIKVGREMPPKFPKGRLSNNAQFFFGNISFEPAKEKSTQKYILREGFLNLVLVNELKVI